DTPVKVDVIILVGGGDEGRMKKAAELYHEGYAKNVIITPENEKIYSQSTEFAMDLGILEKSIIEESDATSTYTNATNSLHIMKTKGFESALVVTSDYHLKRTEMIYNRVNDDFSLKYIASRGKNGEAWYEKQYAFEIWLTEFYKIWAYKLGLYHFIDK